MNWKNIICCICSLIFSSSCLAQDSLFLDFGFYKEESISVGYNRHYLNKETDDKPYHFIETRIQRQHFGGQTFFYKNVNAGFELGLNTSDFIVCPKIGGACGFGIFTAGIDLVYYTNFTEGSLRIIPYFGMGTDQFRLTINPHIFLNNKEFVPNNTGHINLTIKLFKLKKEQIH